MVKIIVNIIVGIFLTLSPSKTTKSTKEVMAQKTATLTLKGVYQKGDSTLSLLCSLADEFKQDACQSYSTALLIDRKSEIENKVMNNQ